MTPTIVDVPVLSCADVTKAFGGVHALRGVSLSIQPGEVVGLIGPNGSGKSTLLHCLGGAMRLSSGTVRLGKRDVTGLKPFRLARLGVSRTFQRNRVFDDLTVLENLLASRDWGQSSWIDLIRPPSRPVRERANQLLASAGLLLHSDTPASALSGGQRRLLEISMALMPGPRVLMLDEATSGVNPTMIQQFVEYLRETNRRDGCAILVVEHNLQFISDLATRVIALEQGRILVEGRPDDVLGDERLAEAYLGL